MRIDTLRRFDKWIGRPICSVITIAYHIKKVFSQKGNIKDPQKILFIKLFGIGSIVLALPSVTAVKRRFPKSSLYFLTFKENEDVLTLTGIIPKKNIYTIRKDKVVNLVSDAVKSLFSLIRGKIDVVIDFEFFSRFTAIFSFLTFSQYRIGFHGFTMKNLYRGSFMDFKIPYNHTLHISKAFFTLIRPLGITQEEYDPLPSQIAPRENFREKIASMIGRGNKACNQKTIERWVVINPNASELVELRKWPKEHFISLFNLLLAGYASFGIILIGGEDERNFVGSLVKSFETTEKADRIVNLAGMTSIKDLIDIFYFSDLFISNDSGPAHLAALTDIPSIVLFGPETPLLYSPLGRNSESLYLGLDCQPCVNVYNEKRSSCHNNICLQKIEPTFVFELARHILQRA